MFSIYIKRAAEAFGITHTREIYEKAIEVLPDNGARYYQYNVDGCTNPVVHTHTGKCVCAMLSWKPSWERLIEPGLCTAMDHSSVIPE